MVPDLLIMEIEYGSDAYEVAFSLRDAVLRRPLGLALDAADRECDRGDRHFAAFDGETVVACLVATPLGGGVFRLRQMAVAGQLRGRGLGTLLMREVESVLRAADAVELTLHARVERVAFYERLGFKTRGPTFIEVTVPHRAMRKSLRATDA
ncbi:MAG: GNAT family N-acetyltransferase [Planctomycetota bacterium]